MGKSKSFSFDGGAADYLGTAVLAVLVTIFSLGLAVPYAIVLRQRWRTKHTMINGQRLVFLGTGISLFGNWLKWFVLIIVTLGIYGLWVVPRLTKWVVENTDFASAATASALVAAAAPSPRQSAMPPARTPVARPRAPRVARYFRRRWDESRGGLVATWGGSDWYFETDIDGQVLRQVTVYDGGQVLRYDRATPNDAFGAMRTDPLDLEDFRAHEVSSEEFERAWSEELFDR